MMIDGLLVIICVIAIFQKTKERFNAAMTFAIFCGVHGAIGRYVDAPLYYYSAMVFSVSMLGVFCCLMKPMRLTDNLVDISIISLIINFYGLMIYEAGFLHDTYNIFYAALYLIAILSLLRGDCANEYSSNKWHTFVRTVFDKGLGLCRTLSKEERS